MASETLESQQMQDLVDSISSFVDELPDNQDRINTSLEAVQEFFETVTEDDEKDEAKRDKILYPFRDKTQPVYRKNKIVLDRTLSRVYPVVTDLINSTYLVGSQENTLGKGLTTKLEDIRTSQSAQLPVQQALPPEQKRIFQPSFFGRISNALTGKKVEQVVENPWETSHNMILEAMNIPNVYKKIIKAHATGRLRAYHFRSDMNNWRRGEVWYLESHVSPELMKMIDASDNIVRGYELKNIALVLSKYYEQKERQAGMLGLMQPQTKP